MTVTELMAPLNLKPLWEIYRDLVTLQPQPRDRAEHWSWAAVEPLVKQAIADVDMREAERRVLLFSNPDLAPGVSTTMNLQAGLQILAAGESAEPHRHTAAALRFIIAGGNATTSVDGSVCAMNTGDLVLTPGWAWHGHHNAGDETILWLDVLDIPIARSLDQVFFEPRLPAPLAPAAEAERFRYPWSEVVQRLGAASPDPDGVVRAQYMDRLTGGAVMPTLDCQAWEVRGTSRTARTTASMICFVVEGEGTSDIGDRTVRWSRNDLFTIPNWTWASHEAAGGGPARLFVVTDAEIFRRIGLLREELD